METVKLSPKYQVVIPRSVREGMKLSPGQEVAVIRYRGRIELIPMIPVKGMRGFLRGFNPSVERESDREL